MTPVQTLLQEILAAGGLSTVFQPIFEIHGAKRDVFAVEALSRGPKGSNAERADVLFEYVRLKGKEPEVDRVCTTAALEAAAANGLDCALSINVHAATLERDEQWVEFLAGACARRGIPLGRVILEIVEQQKFWDERRLFRTLDQLRASGVRIAIDDVGVGYSNYRMLLEIRPDFFKIDPYFVTGSAGHPPARAAIESVSVLAERLGGRVIAKGVESESDVRTVEALGVHLMQGYYLGSPSLTPPDVAVAALV